MYRFTPVLPVDALLRGSFTCYGAIMRREINAETTFKSKKERIPRIILLVESSRESGRALLRGIANYAHHHGPWSFYWEPGGLEKAWPALQEMEANGIILRDVKQVDEALASGLPAVVIGHRQSEI